MSESRGKGRDSGSIKIGDANAVWKYLAVLGLGIASSQFIPTVTGTAVTKSEVAQIRTDVAALRMEMRAGFSDVKAELREQVGLHDQKTAHEGALRMLLRHGELLSEQKASLAEVKARAEAHVRQHP